MAIMLVHAPSLAHHCSPTTGIRQLSGFIGCMLMAHALPRSRPLMMHLSSRTIRMRLVSLRPVQKIWSIADTEAPAVWRHEFGDESA
jgi:hypothetical protein